MLFGHGRAFNIVLFLSPLPIRLVPKRWINARQTVQEIPSKVHYNSTFNVNGMILYRVQTMLKYWNKSTKMTWIEDFTSFLRLLVAINSAGCNTSVFGSGLLSLPEIITMYYFCMFFCVCMFYRQVLIVKSHLYF